MRLGADTYAMEAGDYVCFPAGQTVTLLLGEERFEMKAGGYVCFPAGCQVGHSFMNSGTGPCSYLMIGEHDPNDVCVYLTRTRWWSRHFARGVQSSTWLG